MLEQAFAKEDKRLSLADELFGSGKATLCSSIENISVIIEGSVKNGDHWRHTVSYDGRCFQRIEFSDNGKAVKSHARDEIPAFLLEPIKPNGAGIVALHQHRGEYHLGKSEVAGVSEGRSGDTQKYAAELADLGFTVACFDFKGFEDRQYKNESLKNVWGERYASQEALQDGRTLMGDYVMDAMGAVDLLKLYGISKVGIIGHSLAGTVAVYTMALDERIAAGASNCGIATLDSIRNAQRVHNLAWPIPGTRNHGEIYRLCELIASRPLLISQAAMDPNFPLAGAIGFVYGGRRYYADPEMLQFSAFSGKHSFPKSARIGAYTFLAENLLFDKR